MAPEFEYLIGGIVFTRGVGILSVAADYACCGGGMCNFWVRAKNDAILTTALHGLVRVYSSAVGLLERNEMGAVIHLVALLFGPKGATWCNVTPSSLPHVRLPHPLPVQHLDVQVSDIE